jgi:hypothetical protein
MADRLIKTETLQDIADAIRERTEKTDKIKPSKFAEEIRTLSVGDNLEEYDGSVTVDEGEVVFEEDYTEGFNDGKTEGYSEGYSTGKTDGYEEGYGAGLTIGESSGKETGLRVVWNGIQANGTRTHYGNAFQYWEGDEGFKPIYDMNTTNVAYMFSYAKITDLKGILETQGVTIDFTNALNLYYFAQYSTITRVPKIKIANTENAGRSFFYCEKLVSVDSISINAETGAPCDCAGIFQMCGALEEVRFVYPFTPKTLNFQWSPKLSKASHESLINALSADASGLTVTFSKTAVNKAFETSEGANDGSTSAESEWFNLIATKPNWTINLV